MKLLILYSLLPAILLQAISASTSGDERATLISREAGRQKKAKSVGGISAKKRKAPSATKKSKKVRKSGKSNGVATEDKPRSLSAILPKPLVKIVIDYWDAYPILVSTRRWSLNGKPQIAVDSTRLYMITKSEGIKGLNHSLANLKKDECCCIEFGDPRWLNYDGFRSSYDGRCVFFKHLNKVSTDGGERTVHSIKWLIQSNELKDQKFKHVAFDSGDLSFGLLSRSGQTLVSYSAWTDVTRIYQIKEEVGKDPTAFVKLELNGKVRAVSGKGNRILVQNADWLEVHDISKDASSLACKINSTGLISICALSEDGSKAAFVDSKDGVVQIVSMERAAGNTLGQPAVVIFVVPESFREIDELVYSDESKLHVLHKGGSVSLFDLSTKELTPIEVPEEGQLVIGAAISPNADYFATIQCAHNEESGKTIFETNVKRRSTDAELIEFL